jgi:hypothetical protein
MSGIALDNAWHHAAVVYEATDATVSLYLDGKIWGAPNSVGKRLTAPPNDAPLRLGTRSSATSDDFRGVIDELKIYGYARSAEQIARDAERP